MVLVSGLRPEDMAHAVAGSASDLSRWMMPDLFIDLARGLDRCCFDYMIIEDSSMVPYTYKGSHDVYLKYAASTPSSIPPSWSLTSPWPPRPWDWCRRSRPAVPALPDGPAGQCASIT